MSSKISTGKDREVELKSLASCSPSPFVGTTDKTVDKFNVDANTNSIQSRPPLPRGDSKSTNGQESSSSTPSIQVRERNESSGSHISINFTPAWHIPYISVKPDSVGEPQTKDNETNKKRTPKSTRQPVGIADAGDSPDGSNEVHDDGGESALLEHLERKVGFGDLGGMGSDNLAGIVGFVPSKGTVKVTIGVAPNSTTTHERSGTITNLLSHVRSGRNNSVDSYEYMKFDQEQKDDSSFLHCCYAYVTETLHYLTPDFYHKLNIYAVAFFILLIYYAAYDSNDTIWYLRVYICTVALEFGCSMLDRVVYKIIDILFESSFDIAYQLHSLNGPLGLIVAIFIMREYWDSIGLGSSVIPQWDNLLTAAIVLVICLAAKNWLTRKQYIQLLESRFSGKVENLNSIVIILSELASTRPPRSAQLQRAADFLAKKTNSDVTQSVASNITNKVRNVFADIVDCTLEEDNQEEVITRRELYLKRRSFWKSAARLNATAGRMKVITYNGVANINNQSQAKEFGRKLYQHLSKGGKVVITPELIRRLFEERCEIVNRDLDEKADHDLEMQQVASSPASTALYQSDGEISDLWVKAVAMFDPFNLGRISEDNCVEAVLNVYKEQRYTAAGISDFGELHQSLRIAIDIFYWIVMMFALQAIFGFEITSYILPFITILLTFSFAIATLVGNVLLSFAFVFLMSPYDVGHKVQFGLSNLWTPPVVGFIKSVTLLYTIVTTTKNETVKIPNHTLFFEKIFNFTETSGAVHEFTVNFNIYGKKNADHEKIKLFFSRLKHYTLRESKEWKSFSVSANAMNTQENAMEYKVFCTHREGWGFYQAVAVAKMEYYEMIKKLSDELGLVYHRAHLPVALTEQVDKHDNVNDHGHDVYPAGAYVNVPEEVRQISQDDSQLRRRTNVPPSLRTSLSASPLGSPASV